MGFVTAAFEHKTIKKHTKVSALGREYNGRNPPEQKQTQKLQGNDLINQITFFHDVVLPIVSHSAVWRRGQQLRGLIRELIVRTRLWRDNSASHKPVNIMRHSNCDFLIWEIIKYIQEMAFMN